MCPSHPALPGAAEGVHGPPPVCGDNLAESRTVEGDHSILGSFISTVPGKRPCIIGWASLLLPTTPGLAWRWLSLQPVLHRPPAAPCAPDSEGPLCTVTPLLPQRLPGTRVPGGSIQGRLCRAHLRPTHAWRPAHSNIQTVPGLPAIPHSRLHSVPRSLATWHSTALSSLFSLF